MDKAQKTIASQTESFRMLQISYQNLSDMNDIAQATATSNAERCAMAMEDIYKKDCQIEGLLKDKVIAEKNVTSPEAEDKGLKLEQNDEEHFFEEKMMACPLKATLKTLNMKNDPSQIPQKTPKLLALMKACLLRVILTILKKRKDSNAKSVVRFQGLLILNLC